MPISRTQQQKQNNKQNKQGKTKNQQPESFEVFTLIPAMAPYETK